MVLQLLLTVEKERWDVLLELDAIKIAPASQIVHLIHAREYFLWYFTWLVVPTGAKGEGGGRLITNLAHKSLGVIRYALGARIHMGSNILAQISKESIGLRDVELLQHSHDTDCERRGIQTFLEIARQEARHLCVPSQ
jgi:hypothetical protein